MSKEYYTDQLEELLSDTETYAKLERDPTPQYREETEALINCGYQSHVLSVKEKKFLIPSSSQIPTIYTLPKIHKDPTNPPPRPIVNGIGSVTSRLGQYLDTFLQKSVVDTKAYLKDTKSLLQELQEITLAGKGEVFLVTSDVTSLYTVIQHEDALLALNWALSRREDLPFGQKVFFKKCTRLLSLS